MGRRKIGRKNRGKFKIKYVFILFVIIGVSLIGYSVCKIINGKLQIQNSMKKFEKLDKDKKFTISKVKDKDNKANEVKGDILGVLINKRLNAYIPVVEGTDKEQLKKGAGHYIDSSMPSKGGQCFLFGHRDTVFSPLQYIKNQDIFIFKTIKGEFKYKIKKTKITYPDSDEILQNYGDDTLILVTCYPFKYIGSAPKRFVVICERIN